jgi:hypothetical protein
MAPGMKTRSTHFRLLVLLCLLLTLATGALMLASDLAGAAPFQADPARDAYERVVPGMTRAEDLAGLGIATASPLSGTNAAARLPHRIDRAIDACVAAQDWCTGYVVPQAGRDAVLLVMNGRVIFKAIAAPSAV